jgi:biopolymer transport protein ExbB
MRILLLLSLYFTSLIANNELDLLLQKVQTQGFQTSSENKVREQQFQEAKKRQKTLLLAAQKELKLLKSRSKKLNSTIDNNEKKIVLLEEKLRHKTGSLGELFGVVKQSAGDLEDRINNTVTYTHFTKELPLLGALGEAKKLPNIEDLRGLWYLLLGEIAQSGKIINYQGTIVNKEGHEQESLITQIGAFGVSSNGAFLEFNSETKKFIAYATQPKNSLTQIANTFAQSTVVYSPMVIDPTRGLLLGLEGEIPTLEERIEQGGLVGYIILALGALGLVLVLIRSSYLTLVHFKIQSQLKSLDQIRNSNPLGRVLSVYNAHKEQMGDVLEMKLEEAVLKELPAIERGDSFLKLLASVAPLLGLLGTVTGMILTFQAITLFGTGDAKLMAGGISQALITTVLGLVVAIPLIFLHNLIHTKARNLIHLLEEQSAGLMAQYYARHQ